MANDIRLPHVDLELSRKVSAQLKTMIGESEQLLSGVPTKLAQRRYSMFSSEMKMLANYAYALGEPLSQVAEHLRNAAEAKLRVFELRDRAENLPIETVTISVDRTSGKQVNVEREMTVHLDYSLTNSRNGLDAVYLALASGHPLLARRIAQLIGDPPSAPYVGAGSEICTPDDQHIAYALKHYLAADHQRATAELRQISGSDPRTATEAALVDALVDGDCARFLRALTAHLAWHSREALKKRNRKDTTYFLNLPALGVAALALTNGLITISDLPDDVPHFPVQLLAGPT